MLPADLILGLAILAPGAAFFAPRMHRWLRARRLRSRARRALGSGDPGASAILLREALRAAREEPGLERRLLADLARVYRDAGIAAETSAYGVLIDQADHLARLGSRPARAERQEVQALKRTLLARFPGIPARR